MVLGIEQASIEERKVIYRARRGLKELDIYFEPYVRHHYLQASAQDKALFAELIEQEDPDLLDWFMNVSRPADDALWQFIQHVKTVYQP